MEAMLEMGKGEGTSLGSDASGSLYQTDGDRGGRDRHGKDTSKIVYHRSRLADREAGECGAVVAQRCVGLFSPSDVTVGSGELIKCHLP
jgi:hypothetical protein